MTGIFPQQIFLKHSKAETFARYLLTVIIISLICRAIVGFGNLPLYSDEPSPAIVGAGSTDSAGKARPGDPTRASLTLQQRIASVDVVYANVESNIFSTRLSGKVV